MRNKVAIILPLFLPTSMFFPFWSLKSSFVTIFFLFRETISHYLMESLLAKNPLSFSSFENVLISFQFLKDISMDIEFTIDISSLSVFEKYYITSFWPHNSNEKSAVILTGIFLKARHDSLGLFSRLLLLFCISFQKFNYDMSVWIWKVYLIWHLLSFLNL